MKAWLVVKSYSQLDTSYTYDGNRQIQVQVSNPYVSNWNIINAENKWEAEGRGKELAEEWIKTAKDVLPEYDGTGRLSVQVWELSTDNMIAITAIFANTIQK
jgi:hypothetical protein